jgi:tRNA nucleotidyltransferase (CCA-adding enzyme)
MLMAQPGYVLTKTNRARLESLMKLVLEDVKPTKAELEETKKAINIIMERLRLVTPKNVEILLAGSVARGTHVRGNFDIDIFLLFPRSMSEDIIEKEGLEIAKKVIKGKDESYSIKYAEHPYTKLAFGSLGVEAEIVPAYKINAINERGTAVDRTQLHNEFVISSLTDRQKDEVRVLKTFLHSHGVYGAEARIEGFSGYLCELLIHHYGSFANILGSVSNVKLPLAIDVLHNKEYTKGSGEAKAILDKFNHPFIVLDPTDENRNVAANVSEESLSRFAIAARNILKNPDKRAFYGSGYSDALSKGKIARIRGLLGADLYAIGFKLPDIAEDITWQQLKKLNSRLSLLLKEHRFSPLLTLQDISGRDAVIAFLIGRTSIKSRVVEGPSVAIGEAYERFVKAHRNAILLSLDRDRIYSIEPARYRTPRELLRGFLLNKKEALPSYLDRKSARLYVNEIPEGHAKMLYRAYSGKTIGN